MMKSQIPNVTNYIEVRNKLFLASRREIYSLDETLHLNDLEYDTASLMHFKDLLIVPVSDGFGNTLILHTITGDKELLQGSCNYNRNSSNKLIIKEWRGSFDNYLLKIFDLNDKTFIYESRDKFDKFYQSKLDNDKFIYEQDSSKVLVCFHLPTETTLWQYDTSVLGVERVDKIFGVFGKVLVVLGQKASESTGSGVPNLPIIFGISTESGELLWKQDEAFLHGYDAPYSVYTPLLEPQTGRVVIFSNGLYTEIDATSGEIILWKNLHENPLSASGHTMDRFCFDPSQVDETYIYFRTGIGHSSNRTGLGVFNRKLQQLESLEILKDEKGKPVSMGPQRIQATKDKIYALDLKNTLHIFEREITPNNT